MVSNDSLKIVPIKYIIRVMKFTVSAICAILGIAFAITSCIAGVRTIVDGVYASQHVISSPGSDPSQLAAIIGETIIAFVCRGIIALIPAILIYVALVPFRLRKQWFYSGARLASYCLLLLFPLGTICGCIFLAMLRRRRSEFARSGSLSEIPSEPTP